MSHDNPSATGRTAPRRRDASRYDPDFDALVLTTLGSRNVAVAVTPSPFRENPGGATLWLRLHDGPLAITLTTTEARHLAHWLNAVIEQEKHDEPA